MVWEEVASMVSWPGRRWISLAIGMTGVWEPGWHGMPGSGWMHGGMVLRFLSQGVDDFSLRGLDIYPGWGEGRWGTPWDIGEIHSMRMRSEMMGWVM